MMQFSLEAFRDRSRPAGLLAAGEEAELVRQAQEGSTKALDTLVRAFAGLILREARRQGGYGDIEDFFAEGVIGFVRAVRKWNPGAGARLATYAHHWIRAQIQDYAHATASQVKPSRSGKNKMAYFGLPSRRSQIEMRHPGLTTHEINIRLSEGLGISVSQAEMITAIRGGLNPSLDAVVATPSRDPGETRQTFLEDSGPSPEDALIEREEATNRRLLVEAAFLCLDEREALIVRTRYMAEDGEGLTLADLGEKFGISRERVRQIEVRALGKLKEFFIKDRDNDEQSI